MVTHLKANIKIIDLTALEAIHMEKESGLQAKLNIQEDTQKD